MRVLLFLATLLPALAIAWGTENGNVVFVLYRQPKLAAAMIAAWVVIAVAAWRRPEVLDSTELAKTLRQPAMAAMAALLAWASLTRLWVKVPENFLYELSQFLTLAILLVVLLTWSRWDTRVEIMVRWGLVASGVALTAVGILQYAGRLPALLPINPGIGAVHPGLMGYKNPAAHAILGQVFILLGLILDVRPRAWRRACFLVLAAEVGYLFSLGSRTAAAALMVAVLVFALLALRQRRSRGRIYRAVFGLVLVGLAFAAVLSNEAARQRWEPITEMVTRPTAFLESDRGVYLRNTLNMARHNPLGVGLGDWQTHYPVYRKVGRDVSFNNDFQVRRAHSDHVQALGELGWPGVVLWMTWLVLVLGTALRRQRILDAAQLIAVLLAMTFDYVAELPYGKFQLFLLVFLALARSPRESTKPAAPSLIGKVLAALLTAVALVVAIYFNGLVEKARWGTQMERLYSSAISALVSDGRVSEGVLREVLVLGTTYERLSGVHKTLYRDDLLLAHTAFLLNEKALAQRLAQRALRRHPYSPDALRMMSRVTSEPSSAAWQRAHEYVMNEAEEGFRASYPDISRTSR